MSPATLLPEPPLKLDSGCPEGPRPSFPIDQLRGVLPLADFDDTVDHEAIAASCLTHLKSLDAQVLSKNAIWRDLYAMTGKPRTFSRVETIISVWKQLSLSHKVHGFCLKLNTSKIVRLGKHCWIQANFSFRTAGVPPALCSGQLGVAADPELGWKIWLITTVLEELDGFPNPDHMSTKALNDTHQGNSYECVVVGAGYAGLCLAGRLKAIGVDCITLERNCKIGDNWMNRYESARCRSDNYG